MMSERDTNRSVKTQMMIMRKVLSGAGQPKNTFMLINLRIYGQSYLFVGVMETFSAHAMFFLYMWRHAGYIHGSHRHSPQTRI
jgi:hypothetical protein